MRPALFVLVLFCLRLPVVARMSIPPRRSTRRARTHRRGRTTRRLSTTSNKPTISSQKTCDIEPHYERNKLSGRRPLMCIAGRFCAMAANSTKPRPSSEGVDHRSLLVHRPAGIEAHAQDDQEAQNPSRKLRARRQRNCANCCRRRRARSNWRPSRMLPITLKVTEKSQRDLRDGGQAGGSQRSVRSRLYAEPGAHRTERRDASRKRSRSFRFETKTFWRPVTPNTIFVAQDNPAKRKELEQNVLKTFYLSNLSQPTELQDVVNAMRTILEVSRIQQLPSQGAIVVRGTPDQVALAQKLVDDLDKAKPEVLIEVAVMEVSRDKMKKLGISPPTNVAVQLQPNVNTTPGRPPVRPEALRPRHGQTNRHQPEHVRIPERNRFPGDDSAGSATALLSDSTSKIIQNPQIRALDGQKATSRSGNACRSQPDRSSRAFGGVGINPLVNTQFQYIDVGVNIDITPRVHADREISHEVVRSTFPP